MGDPGGWKIFLLVWSSLAASRTELCLSFHQSFFLCLSLHVSEKFPSSAGCFGKLQTLWGRWNWLMSQHIRERAVNTVCPCFNGPSTAISQHTCPGLCVGLHLKWENALVFYGTCSTLGYKPHTQASISRGSGTRATWLVSSLIWVANSRSCDMLD